MRGSFFEGNQIVPAFDPVNLGGQANNGDWVNLRNYFRLVVVLIAGIGAAGEDPVFTLRQAQDNAGTGAKALEFTRVYEKVGVLANVGVFTKVEQVAAGSYTNAASGEVANVIAVEILPEQMDEGFTHVQLQIPDTGVAAQLGAAFYLLLDPRYRGAESVSAID